MEMKKEMEPTGDLWVPMCRKKNGKCNMMLRSVHFLPTVRAAAQPSQDIARICVENPNRFADAQVIMAAPKLFWACVEALKYFEKDNSEWMLNRCITMLKQAVQLARNGYSPELRERSKKGVNRANLKIALNTSKRLRKARKNFSGSHPVSWQ
jgi:hypothetical protein